MEEQLFWEIEYEYYKSLDKVLGKCKKVKNLKEALDTGLNSIWLEIGDGIEYVGFKEPDNGYSLDDKYERMYQNGERDGLEATACEFVETRMDDDGYTMGVFKMKGEE